MKSPDKLTQYLSSLKALTDEKTALEQRLAEINSALGQREIPQTPPPRPQRQPSKLSLKEAIRQVTRQKPMTKPEILAAVQKLGYQFTTPKPMESLNAMLYAKQNGFVRKNEKWQG